MIVPIETFIKAIYYKKPKGFFLKLSSLSRKLNKKLNRLEKYYNQSEKYIQAYQTSKSENQWATAEVCFRYIRAKYYRECYEKLNEQYIHALNVVKRYFPGFSI